MPVYNTEDYLLRCAESIEAQTYKNIELIIVNDGSQGPVNEIVASLKRKYNNIVFVDNIDNKGLFRARVDGLKIAKGEFFSFVDSDDEISIDFYRVLIKKALEDNADIVAADVLEKFENEGSLVNTNGVLYQKDWDLKNNEIIDTLISFRGLDYSWWVTWNKIYNRHIWEDSKDLICSVDDHIVMCEDVAFSTTFFSVAKHFTNTHHNYYYYYRGDNSSTVAKNISCNKYQKNLKDIEHSFNIARIALENIDKYELFKNEMSSWKNSILNSWKAKISEDKKLSKADRCNLLHEIKNQSSFEAYNDECDQNRNFCYHQAKWYGEDLYNNIKNAISSSQCEIVSFDVFDTLLTRPFLYPTDLFHFMDLEVNKLIDSTDYFVFANIRIEAERVAREINAINNPSWEDISLDDIYKTVVDMCPALKGKVEDIKKLEISLEERFLKPREAGIELLECARSVGKKVICTSDMYLTRDVIRHILDINKINVDDIYVSCEVGGTKASGHLYEHIKRKLDINGSQIVHIGDNFTSDVEMAIKAGIRAFHFPRTIDMFLCNNSCIPSGNHYKYFAEKKGIHSTTAANDLWGYRCLQAVLANKIFDNPFIIWNPNSDFNANPSIAGYMTLGLQILAVVCWLYDSVNESKFDCIEFMARDGYLPMKAFEMLKKVYGLEIDTDYLYFSRKAIIPMMLINSYDFYALHNAFTIETMTPKKFLNVTSLINDESSMENAESILKEAKITMEKPFGNQAAYLNFGKIYMDKFFSKKKLDEYIAGMKTYLDGKFKGNTATFDVGYNLRCETILRANFGYDITAHYIHINNDRPFGRIDKIGAKIKTLIPHSPFITGIMREQLMSGLQPSCIGYAVDENGKMKPKFEEDWNVNIQTKYVTESMQNAALDYVRDVLCIFGKNLQDLPFRYYDAAMPLEIYFNDVADVDKSIWCGTKIEDDMGMGRDKNLVDFWNHELNRWGSEQQSARKGIEIDYEAAPFIRRWLMIFAFDWAEGKRRIAHSMKKVPVLFNAVVKVYVAFRAVGRFIGLDRKVRKAR